MTDAVTNARAQAFAHRAIVAATIAGLLKPRRGLRVLVASADAGAGANAVSDASADAGADVLVMTDEGAAADSDVASVMARARACVGGAGVVALVVGSVVTSELVDAARHADRSTVARAGHGDAYAHAMEWANERSRSSMAPAVTPERLAQLVDAAAASGLTLVEPESSAVVPALARVRGMKSPRARALLATIALGASARPLLFVPADRAPKGGLARLKVERLADGWVEVARPSAIGEGPGASHGELVDAALAILHDAARAGREPLLFKELLREGRERWSSAARTRGGRATASASDAADLAAFLHRQAADESVLLYALDPADPAWALTNAPLWRP